jgi:hypothetical protein
MVYKSPELHIMLNLDMDAVGCDVTVMDVTPNFCYNITEVGEPELKVSRRGSCPGQRLTTG